MKSKISTSTFIFALVLWGQVNSTSFAEGGDKEKFDTFVRRNCVECHATDDPGIGVSFTSGESVWEAEATLSSIHDVLSKGEMPPEDATERPTLEQRQLICKLLESRLKEMAAIRVRGILKRLNKVEYQNSVNDVLRGDLDVLSLLPVDNTGRGFSNNGEQLFMSPFALDTYYRVATTVAEKVVKPRPSSSTKVLSVENLGVRKLFDKNTITKDKALVFSSNHHSARIMIDVQDAGFYEVKINGYYHEGVLQYGRGGDREATRETGVPVPAEYQLLKYTTNTKVKNRPVMLAEGEFKLRDRIRVYLRPGDYLAISSYGYPFPLPQKLDKYDHSQKVEQPANRSMFCIQSASVTGPLFETWPPQSPFYDEYFDGVGEDADFDTCQAIIRRIAQRIFRRPSSDSDLQVYFNIAKREYTSGRNVLSGVQSALKAMLCSPDFLYKREGVGESIGDFAIAARLSFFLWNSTPDDQLLKLAAAGSLRNSKDRVEAARRLLEDPKAERFVRDFTSQWLELHKLDGVAPMPELYSERQFAILRPHLKEQTFALFREILSNNLSVDNFVSPDFVMLNHELNDVYKLNARVGRARLQRVDVKDTVRGGLLTQPGILLMTTNGEFTNPFYRGAWVLKNLYGEELEPPNDAVISSLMPPTESSNIKENIRLHRQEAKCNRCHRKMDPFGLALENFDVVGRWRDEYSKVVETTQKVPVKGKPGTFKEVSGFDIVPTDKVESRTTHDDGRVMSGPAGVKQVLMQDRELIAKNLLRKVFGYAMGRRDQFSDREAIDAIHAHLLKHDYRLEDLILAVVGSDAFVGR